MGWIIIIVVLVVCGYMGWLRPTGLAARTGAQKEEDHQQDVAAKWLNKDGERPDGPQ